MAQAQGPQAPPGKPSKPKKRGVKPDLATFAGIALAMAGILGGLLLEKGKMQDVMQATAALIVLGGTFGAVLVTTPLPVVLRAFRGLGNVFFEQASSMG